MKRLYELTGVKTLGSNMSPPRPSQFQGGFMQGLGFARMCLVVLIQVLNANPVTQVIVLQEPFDVCRCSGLYGVSVSVVQGSAQLP